MLSSEVKIRSVGKPQLSSDEEDRGSVPARGYDENLLEGYNAEFAMPDTLIKRSINADSVLCY